MKKIIVFSILLVFSLSLLGIEVKIGLSQDGGPFKNIKEIVIESDRLILNDSLELPNSVKIKFSKGKLLVLRDNEVIYEGIYLKISADSGIIKLKRTDSNLILKVPGYLVIFPSDYIQLINVLDLETYVSLVIPHEIGNAPFEAIKAQAVISRTYTLKNLGRHSDEGFDLCSTVHCQVYRGIPNTNLTKYVNATRETFGETLLYKEKLIDPVFSSHNGGVIASASEVWKGNYPYILPLDDVDKNGVPFGAFSDNYSWIVEISRMELYRKLLSNPNYFPGAFISGIEILERGPSGRVTKIKIKGEKDLKMSGNTFRFLAGLKSTLFDVEYIPSADKFVFKGRGWGHGVGLSQWGAIDMASRGIKYTDILQHYYRGSYLNRGLRIIINNYDSIKNLRLKFYIDGIEYKVQGKETIIPNVPIGFHEIRLSSSNVLFEDIIKKVFISDEKGVTLYFNPSLSKNAPVLIKKPDVVFTSENSLKLRLDFVDSNGVIVPYNGKITLIDKNGNKVVVEVENSLHGFPVTLKLVEGENLFKVIPKSYNIDPVWLRIVKNSSLPPKPKVSFKNLSKGIEIYINSVGDDISKVLIYRKSTLNEKWLKVAELSGKNDYFFDIAVDKVGDYIYGVSAVNKFGVESQKVIFSISRDFSPAKVTIKKAQPRPKRMPNLPEKYIDIRSLFTGKLDYVDVKSDDKIKLSNDRITLGNTLRVLPSINGLKIVDKENLVTINSTPKIILESERNMAIKVGGFSANKIGIVAENGNRTINVIFYEKLRDYIARQLTNFAFSNDSNELKKLKAILVRTNVVYSILTGRYKTDEYDLPYILDYFNINGNLSLKEAYEFVDKTENLVITIANKVVDGIFVTDNNGYMAKDSDKWYLIASPSIKGNRILWSKKYTPHELGQIIKKEIVDLGDISKVELLAKDEYGRVTHLRLTGKKGVINIFGEDSIRHILKLDGSVFEVIYNGDFVFRGKSFGNCEGISLKDAAELFEKGWKYSQVIEKYYLDPQIISFLGLNAITPSLKEKESFDFSKFNILSIKKISKNSKVSLSQNDDGIKIKYSFAAGGNGIAGIGIELFFFRPFKSLSIKVNGDSSGNFIRLKFIDSQGEIFLTSPLRINWSGDRKIEVNTNKLIHQSWSNTIANKIPDFPLILKEIYLVDSKNSKIDDGEIILKEMNVSG